MTFAKASEGLTGLLADLMTTYSQDEHLKKNLNRVKYLVDKIVVFFEQKRVTSLIKDADLELSQKTLVLMEEGTRSLTEYVKEKIELGMKFLSERDKEASDANASFEEYLSCKNEIMKFKIFHKFTNQFKRLVSNCKDRGEELNSLLPKSNRLELKELQIKLNERIRLLSDRWKVFEWRNRKILENVRDENKT